MVYIILLIIIQSYEILQNVPSTTPILQIFTKNGQRRNASLPFFFKVSYFNVFLFMCGNETEQI